MTYEEIIDGITTLRIVANAYGETFIVNQLDEITIGMARLYGTDRDAVMKMLGELGYYVVCLLPRMAQDLKEDYLKFNGAGMAKMIKRLFVFL